jgi:hypothetical protein
MLPRDNTRCILVLTAACLIVDPRRYCRHETVLQRPKVAGAGRGGPRGAPKGIAQAFSVSLPTIKRWLKLRKETGALEPRKGVPGPPPRKGVALRAWLPKQLRANPDLTLEEHCQAFEDERAMRVSTATMSRSIRRLPGQ